MTASALYQQITAIGAFTALSSADADYLALDPSKCTGLGDSAPRTTTYDAPGQDGELIFPAYDGQQVITLAGDLICTSVGQSNESGYFAAVDALYASLKTAIDALKAAPGDLVTAGGTLKVWKYGQLEDQWQNYWALSVMFSVIRDLSAE